MIDADKIVCEEWAKIVAKHNLRPGSPTEEFSANVLNRIRGCDQEPDPQAQMVTWRGVPIGNMTRPQLIEALITCGRIIRDLNDAMIGRNPLGR